MGPLAHQLRDIHGLDAVSWWPPAPGWWLLAGLILAALWLARRFLPQLQVPALAGIPWRWDAARKLRDLRRRVGKQDTKQTASELSELLRRIAMARHGRDACAGLTGRDWLVWLQSRDPRGFDWPQQAGLLLDMPYAPPGHSEAEDRHLLLLIDAAQNWVARDDKRAQPAKGGPSPV
jgi:hypothetical protein